MDLFWKPFWIVVGEEQVDLITVIMAPLHLSIPASRTCIWDVEGIVKVINYTCARPAVTCQSAVKNAARPQQAEAFISANET